MKKGILRCILTVSAIFTIFTSNIWAADLDKGLVTERTLAYEVPSEEAKPAGYLAAGEEFAIVETVDDYYGILIEGNELVYIQKQYLQVQSNEQDDSQTQEVIVQPEIKAINKGEEVVNYAKQFIGLSYRSGGTSLQTGVDCSGFTQQIYANFNVSLQRSSRDQYKSNGKQVERAELLPGDLVFYGRGSVRHVAIYIGNDKIIHAPVPGKSVCIVPIWQRGDDPIIGYKRVI
ncbi:C40 family peptidase [Cellulosilyticum sp. I15G10I2]|uniref:C40 family peptidase n=1 Tax=Cellulosilyticum sp. I15G10I2 TaxID=1892843 RepID=UPI00085C62DA|nr:C40 family peptidase [Cellulosilyticum sp. I15G10I2]